MSRVKILFLAANPSETVQLQLDEEIRSITDKIRGSEYRDTLELISAWAVRPDDLLQLLNQHKPHIVHFSSHGSLNGEIILVDNNGKPKPISVEALEALFQTIKDNIRVVFLNACYSQLQAKAITKVIDCAIGMNAAVGDKAAINFAAAFYQAIGFGRSVQQAFEQGKVSLLLEGISEDRTPEIFIRQGVDISLIFPISFVTTSASNSTWLERQTWLNNAMQRSRARCIARWQSTGVSKSDAITLADNPSIGIPLLNLDLSPSKLIILAGEMGIGKSLIGDRLFQSAIQVAIKNSTAPTPVFFEAWQLQGKSLEEAVKEITHGLCNFPDDGVFIIIDGVDEIGATNAVRLLDEARILVQMWHRATILLISKPISEFANAEELIGVPLLSKEVSEELVRQLSKRQNFSANSLPKLLQDAILRPLFAVLLSTHLKERGTWTLQSKEQLLSSLVERSLRPLRENVARASYLLEQLAATCINRGGRAVRSSEIASWTERQQILDSRLVVEDGEELRFPIPILTQWFGAQYLLKSGLTTETFWLDKQRLEFWRYPLVIAVATFPLQRVSELLAPIAEREPLIAADIVSEALAFQGRSMEMPSLSARELAQQVRIAMQVWINGFKTLALSIAPHLENEALPTIGVRISKRQLETDPPTSDQILTAWVEIAWYSKSEDLPDVVELPPDINSDRLSSLGWKGICGFPPYMLASWVWKWTLERVINLLLQQRSIPVGSSLLSLEAAWHGASSLIKRHHLDASPIAMDEIEARLVEVEEIRCAPMMDHCLKQLWIEMEAASAKGLTHLSLPTSFQAFRGNHTHSAEALLAYARDVHLGAFEGYLQLVNTLSPLIPKLKLVSIVPARLVCILALPNDSDSISVSRYWEPLPANSQNEVNCRLSVYPLSGDDKSVMAAMQEWIALRPLWWTHFTMQTSTVPQLTKFWLGANPVTELAYAFLWEDMKRMGWVDDSLSSSGFPYTF